MKKSLLKFFTFLFLICTSSYTSFALQALPTDIADNTADKPIASGNANTPAQDEDIGDGESVDDDDKTVKFDWMDECDDTENAYEVHNISLWNVGDDELYTMHGDKQVYRRSDKAYDSWLIYKIPYLEELNVTIYTWTENESDMYFYTSADCETWTEVKFTAEISRYDDRWTKIVFYNKEIQNTEYVKIVFPAVNPEVDDWWNPYLGEVAANVGEPYPCAINAEIPNIVIPCYDFFEYTLRAEVIDQLGKPMDIPVKWRLDPVPEHVTLTEDGKLKISSECAAETELALTAYAESDDITDIPSYDVCIKLASGIIGDYNSDLKIDKDDLDFAVKNYNKNSADDEWDIIRLVDIDGNGHIDIADLSYIAFNCEDTESDLY